tara:strand:- start:1564 stop:1926 length:363 start_codon:yes stop_codon:yes gene_type:complete
MWKLLTTFVRNEFCQDDAERRYLDDVYYFYNQDALSALLLTHLFDKDTEGGTDEGSIYLLRRIRYEDIVQTYFLGDKNKFKRYNPHISNYQEIPGGCRLFLPQLPEGEPEPESGPVSADV